MKDDLKIELIEKLSKAVDACAEWMNYSKFVALAGAAIDEYDAAREDPGDRPLPACRNHNCRSIACAQARDLYQHDRISQADYERAICLPGPTCPRQCGLKHEPGDCPVDAEETD